MRALFQFAKLSRLRFVSHLDLQRFMQTALRRTQLPVAYSQGYNPHPVMAFASALAVGWTSDCEILDVKLAEPVEEEFAFSQMAAALPPHMPLRRVRLVDDRHPAMMAVLKMADYEITLSGESAAQTAAAIGAYMDAPSVIALRKTKSGEKPADIRAMTLSLRAEGAAQQTILRARLMLTEKATLRPSLLVDTLAKRAGVEAPGMHIHRLRLLAEGPNGAIELMDF
jgi:radical SAM-linked protein